MERNHPNPGLGSESQQQREQLKPQCLSKAGVPIRLLSLLVTPTRGSTTTPVPSYGSLGTFLSGLFPRGPGPLPPPPSLSQTDCQFQLQNTSGVKCLLS